MEFNKAYKRTDFINFIRTEFLPEDYLEDIKEQKIDCTFIYTKSIIKIGECKSLALDVYEIKHSSKNDARVSLSKESFRILNLCSWNERALIAFVPEDNPANYRISLVCIDRKWEGDRMTKEFSNPRRYSYFLGDGIGTHTPDKYLKANGRVTDFKDLQNRFSVEVLTKAFYNELSDWYAWAIKNIRFPNSIKNHSDDAAFNNESVIRLITRLIFVWFLKQKHLVPDEFFDEHYVSSLLLKDFEPNLQSGLFLEKSLESNYYKAILQNLFFAMLNSPITPEGKHTISERRFSKGRQDFDNNKLMRYKDKFKNPDLFIDIANRTVPFLNGGLFDCLDEKDKELYYDGFSEREVVQKALIVPDYLFFGEEVGKNIDLSGYYGDVKKKRVNTIGIIDILKRYNFTVEENTPADQEISLDPELLGKVFENLLASYNPETQSTARKQTGSFYTPREIVQYMVDESLVAHLKRTVGDEFEEEYRKLMLYTDEEVNLNKDRKLAIMRSLYNCKILDPACGSGAFPMGVLQQMVHILSKLDPQNEQWKKILMENAISETSEVYQNATDEERKEIIMDIERSFSDDINRPDYARKLYLIENCIYGVDIQSIAVQISKLRFFISLVVDQKQNDNPVDNFGIRPLPNLEAKFVAANTLIGLKKNDTTLFDSEAIKSKQEEMMAAKHKIFGAKTHKTKMKYKERVTELRSEIANILKDSGVVGNEEAKQMTGWDMFDQNASSPFFDPEWMFGLSSNNGGYFDIVVANPPYIDSETMSNTMPEFRDILHNKYTTAKGNWDMFVVFIEKGIQLLVHSGILSYIIPNKLIGAKYAQTLRLYLSNYSIIELRDYSEVKVFEAFVYPCTIVLSKCLSKTSTLFAKMSSINETVRRNVIVRDLFIKDLFWDKYFIERQKLSIILKISENKPLCSYFPSIFGAATVNEAYCIKELITENFITQDNNANTYFKFINTGTIDKYTSLWSTNQTQYIKSAYFMPIVYKSDLLQFNKRRYNQANSPKIVIAGMSLSIEALFDDCEYIAGKSTSIIIDEPHKLKFLLAVLNSKAIEFWFKINYHSLSMSGGYINIGVNEIGNVPIPEPTPYQRQSIVTIVDEIIKLKSQDPLTNTSTQEASIDNLVYGLYGINEQEVSIINS